MKKIFNPDLMKIKSNVGQQKVVDFVIIGDGILSYQGRLCAPDIDGLREGIMDKARGSWNAIYPSSMKMYHDLRDFISVII